MSQQSLKDWGAGLSEGDFGRALAALGVAARRQSLPWPGGFDLATRLEEWTEVEPPETRVVGWSAPTPGECAAATAAECAAAWPARAIQIEIREAADLEPFWLTHTLTRPEVAASAVYFRSDRAGVPLTWTWPLRIGLAPKATGEEFGKFEQGLATKAADVFWWNTLTRVVGFDRNRNVCDLLVLPVGLEAAAAALEAQRAPMIAGCVVVLGGAGDMPQSKAHDALQSLRAATGALGAAVFDLSVPDDWLVAVVEEISHDQPLPVAFHKATPEGVLQLLIADRRLAEKTRVSGRFGRLVERLGATTVSETEKPPEIPFEPYPRDRDSTDYEDQIESGVGGAEGGRLPDWGPGGELESEREWAPDRASVEAPWEDAPAAEESAPSRASVEAPPRVSPPPREPARIEVRPGTATAQQLGLEARHYTAAEMASELADKQDRPYDHETGMASAAAEVAEAVAEQEARSAARQARYILTRVFDLTSPGQPVELNRAFHAGAEHDIQVRIGAQSAGGIVPTNLVAVPEELLPEDREEYRLTVIFHEPKLLATPQTATIVLPNRGTSTTASFRLRIPADHRRVDGRVTVAYGNRVLQTALLRGPVVAAGEDLGVIGLQIETEIEAVVRPGMANLDSRRRFDAALVLNHDSDHVPGVTRLADDHVSFVTSNDLGKEIDWFQSRLAQVAYDKSDFDGGLRSDATVDLLRSLARHGRQLYRHVIQDQVGEDPLLGADFIQVIATSDEARLHTEFIYDRKSPTSDPPAPLCPNAERALADGKCVDGCPGGDEEQSVICPMGFWGLKKVLERHAHDPKLARSLRRAHGEYAIQSEPREARAPLPVLRGGQLAATQVVDKGCPGGSQRVQQALVQAIPTADGTPITSWEAWEEGVKSGTQSLLVLLVHTDLVDPAETMQKLEIGNGAWKAVDQLENGTYIAAPGHPAPLVLLLGCETSAPEVSIHSLVSMFRQEGAAIVVSALSKIHASHAVPVAEEFIEQLADIESGAVGAGATETFGEVMCRVRRTMLARGKPMALCLTAYGDADWRLVRALH